MSRKIRNGLIACMLFGFASLLFTILVLTVDVQPIGPNNTSVGFAALNGAFRDALGTSKFLYTVSNLLGYLAILTGILAMAVALVQWIRRKSIFRVDIHLIALGFLFVILGILYVLFDKIAINYRPVLLDGDTTPEPSFPSSHTLLMATVFGVCYIVTKKMFRPGTVCSVLRALFGGLIVIGVLTRLFSGVHWLSDIIASVLYSGLLISLYYSIVNILVRKKHIKKLREEENV